MIGFKILSCIRKLSFQTPKPFVQTCMQHIKTQKETAFTDLNLSLDLKKRRQK